jgi:hypothetical protein
MKTNARETTSTAKVVRASVASRFSIREAGRRSNHDSKALRDAIAAELLHPDSDGLIPQSELERFLRGLGTCRRIGCHRPARYPSFCCSKGHAVSEAKRTTDWRRCANPGCGVMFRPRPEQLRDGHAPCHSRKCAQTLRRRREEAAGKLRGQRVLCKCGCGNTRLVFPSQRTRPPNAPTGYVAGYEFLNARHWARYRWKHGIALKNNARGFYMGGNWTLKTLRHWSGAWAFANGGGRPKEWTTEQAQEAKRLHDRGYGYGSVAAALGVTRSKARRMLAMSGDMSDGRRGPL